MREKIRKLKEQGKGYPGLLFELDKISGFPEQFQSYYLSVLLRTYRNARNFRDQEEQQRVVSILSSAGIRSATMADDIAHQVTSELYLKGKFKLS